MREAPPGRKRRRTIGGRDAMLVLGVVVLLLALGYPRLREAAFDRQVEAVAADVELVRAAAVGFRSREGRFPEDEAPGTVPAELAPLLPPELTFAGEQRRLAWERWEALAPDDSVNAPGAAQELGSGTGSLVTDTAIAPIRIVELGGVTVHTSVEGILAALVERYGSARSFVRESSWTLVVPPAPEGS